MTTLGASPRTRKIELVRFAWGVLLLGFPTQALGATGARVDRRGVVVTRVLGARQVAQAVLSGLRPSPEVLGMGVWVDAVHSASAVGLVIVDRDRAVAGIADATVAAGWSLLGRRDLSRGVATPPAHDRRRDVLARLVLGIAPGGTRLLQLAQDARGPVRLTHRAHR